VSKRPRAGAKGPGRPKRGRPVGAFAQHYRFDQLQALLFQHPKGLTIYELAERLHVTARTVRRYLAELQKKMDVVATATAPGRARRWHIAPTEMPRRVAVRRTQAYALLAARPLFQTMRGSGLYEEIDLAAQRLKGIARRPGRGPNAGVAEARLEERFLYVPFAPKDYREHSEALDDLFHAVADLRPLSGCYPAEDDGGAEQRVVIHPYAMVLYKDAVYCIGLDVARGRVRSFELDRLRDTSCSSPKRFELPDDFRVEDFVQGQFGIGPRLEPVEVVIRIEAAAADYLRTRKVHPSQQIEPLPDGAIRLRLCVGELDEVATWVLGFGPRAEVLAPPELRRRVRQELQAALGRYDD